MREPQPRTEGRIESQLHSNKRKRQFTRVYRTLDTRNKDPDLDDIEKTINGNRKPDQLPQRTAAGKQLYDIAIKSGIAIENRWNGIQRLRQVLKKVRAKRAIQRGELLESQIDVAIEGPPNRKKRKTLCPPLLPG